MKILFPIMLIFLVSCSGTNTQKESNTKITEKLETKKVEIKEKAFEDIYPIDKNEKYYDDGVIKYFIKEYFSSSDVIKYDYIGTLNDIFHVEDFEFNCFQVFKFDIRDKGIYYYLKPHKTHAPAPTIYEVKDGKIQHVWSWSGKY